MGVVYKLDQKVKDFILEQKKLNPTFSCRRISDLILDKFQINVSKSSVNFVVKEAGLSMPVGRRQKKKKRALNPDMSINFELPAKTLFLEKPPVAPIEEVIKAQIPDLPEKPVENLVDKQTEAAPEEPIEAPVEEFRLPVEEPMPPAQEPEPIAPIVEEPVPLEIEKPAEEQQQPPVELLPILEEPILVPVDKPVEKVEEVLPVVEPVKEPTKEPEEAAPVEVKIEEPYELPCSGAILLKAADCLTGGVFYMTEAIKNRFTSQSPDLFAKTECLLYGQLKQDFGLDGLVGRKFQPEDISSHLVGMQSVEALPPDIFRVVSSVFQEVRFIKVTLTNNTIFYLDAKLHTVWSTPSIPYDFASTIYNAKGCINKHFQGDSPIILFMAPGYDFPTDELFDFILSHDQTGAAISHLNLCGNKSEELEGVALDEDKRRFFVLGLWPWQFVEYRKVNKIGDFRPFHFETLNKDYYLAQIEIELTQPNTQQKLMLNGCALKASLSEKTRLIILSNLSEEAASIENLADIYLNRWPNLEEGFKDYSRKIELFTYTADSQRFFSTENLNLLVKQESMQDINSLLDYYLKALDLYVRWHFLPSGYEEKDFSMANQCFYGLKALSRRQKDTVKVTFEIPSSYPYIKDLEYACSRVNEREIRFPDGKKLWLVV